MLADGGLVATIALTSITAQVAKLAPNRLLAYSAISGPSTGMIFLLALEIDTTGAIWFWRKNIQRRLWHASVATTILYAVGSRRT